LGSKSIEIVVSGGSAKLRREPWDCDRLGVETAKVENLVVAHGAAGQALSLEIVRIGRVEGFTLLASRVNTEERRVASCLQLGGFRLVDTVLTLECSTAASAALSAPAGYSVRTAIAADREALGELAADAFTNPNDTFNRYLNDTFLPMSAVRDVYRTWVVTSIEGPAAHLTLAVEHQNEPIAFNTLSFSPQGCAKVGLNAVRSEHRGRGLYRLLVEESLREARSRGNQRISIVTQLQQLAVQHVWLKLGAAPVAAAHSFHRWLGDGGPVRELG
jgi:hypothetical protein